jgi:hypothetical protein
LKQDTRQAGPHHTGAPFASSLSRGSVPSFAQQHTASSPAGWRFYSEPGGGEVTEVSEMFSFPLGLVNSAFVIRPDTGLAEAVGIVTANSYFYALGLTLVFKVVHASNRSRVTQLGISSSALNDDDDEF